MTQRVPYAGFKDKLKSVNIETISSATVLLKIRALGPAPN